MEELKPCPFCGRDVYIVEEGDYVEIACDICGIAMSRDSYDELVESWNNRV